MNSSSQQSEEKPSRSAGKSSNQNESKINELSQMIMELKDEMYRLQKKNSCKINRVENMLTGLAENLKAKEEAAKQVKLLPPPGKMGVQIQPPALSKAKSPNSPPSPLPPMAPPSPMSSPSPTSLPPMTPLLTRSSQTRSLPSRSPPPMSPPPPMTPRNYHQPGNCSHRSYSHGDQRRRPRPRHRRPDPANSNILKAALRVVNELGFDELKSLERHLNYHLFDYESRF